MDKFPGETAKARSPQLDAALWLIDRFMTRVALHPPTIRLDQGSLPSRNEISDFRPPWYLRSGHLQTMLGPYAIRPRVLPSAQAIEVPLPRGGHTYVYETCPEIARQRRDAILLIHGLGGSHSSPYLTRIAGMLADRGFRAIRVDLPGCGPASNLSDMPAHAGCSRELKAILSWGHRNLGIDSWKVAGFSLGGNVTLKMLAELSGASAAASVRDEHADLLIERAVVVAPPIDLQYCCSSLEKGIHKIYNKFFVRVLRRLADHRSSIWPRWSEISHSNRLPVRTIREFDEVYTSRIAGFDGALDYYEKCSTFGQVDRIEIPTTILIDHHDPIVPSAIFSETHPTPFVDIHVTRHGGHMGYIHRNRQGKMACWMDEWIVKQLAAELPASRSVPRPLGSQTWFSRHWIGNPENTQTSPTVCNPTQSTD